MVFHIKIYIKRADLSRHDKKDRGSQLKVKKKLILQADNAGGDLPPRPGIERVTIISPSLH